MAQFSVYKNKNPATRSRYPLLVDIQSDLLNSLTTRVVVPLTKASAFGKKPIATLTPVVEVDGQKFAMLMPQLAAIAAKDLGSMVGTVAHHRSDIVAAVDFLITGI